MICCSEEQGNFATNNEWILQRKPNFLQRVTSDFLQRATSATSNEWFFATSNEWFFCNE